MLVCVLDGLGEGDFTEGHELDRKWRVPKEMVAEGSFSVSAAQSMSGRGRFSTSAFPPSPDEGFVVCYDGNRLARRYRQHNDKT